MRRAAASALFLTTVLGLAVASPAEELSQAEGLTQAEGLSQAEEAFLAIVATGSNIFYTPAKTFVAVASIPVGGLAGLFSGGDVRTAYAIWVPAMGGTYFLTNGHMDGSKPIEFWGSDYADRPPPEDDEDRSIIFSTPTPELYE